MNGPYDDIIGLPHHVSRVHPRMSMYNRAAQFAPFSALTGHEAAIRETARMTDEEILLTPEEMDSLDRKMAYLQRNDSAATTVTVTFFEPDETKQGGTYRTVSGRIKKVEPDARILAMHDGMHIRLDCIKDIEFDPDDMDKK